MRLVTVSQLNNRPYIATVFYDRFVTQLTGGLNEEAHLRTMVDFIRGGTAVWNESYARAKIPTDTAVMLKKCKLHAPIIPRSLRDFYAFEEHVKTANANRGREVPKEWYEVPVFYYSNASAIYGTEEVIPYPSNSKALDYELEIACVIGKEGKDIPAEKAEEYIFGYMIFNDWSARDIQKQEMAVGLGPAKGKDFASSFGPYLVTSDELAEYHAGRPGVYDLKMIARVNDKEYSRGNMKDMHWSFGDLIARASQDVTLYPGDVIASGTVGTGCLLELTKGEGPWLQPGDVVELEIEHLGILRNVVGERPGTGPLIQRQTAEQDTVLVVTPIAEIEPASEPSTPVNAPSSAPAETPVGSPAASKPADGVPASLDSLSLVDTEPFDKTLIISALEKAALKESQTNQPTEQVTTPPADAPAADAPAADASPTSTETGPATSQAGETVDETAPAAEKPVQAENPTATTDTSVSSTDSAEVPPSEAAPAPTTVTETPSTEPATAETPTDTAGNTDQPDQTPEASVIASIPDRPDTEDNTDKIKGDSHDKR